MNVRIIVLIFALCFVGEGVLLAGGEEGSGFIQDKYLSARDSFRKGDYEAAAKGFEDVLKIDPDYKVAVEYLKVTKSKLLAKSEKKNALYERKKGLEAVVDKKEESKIKRESDLLDLKESWQGWLARQREKKRIKQEKKKENARIKRKKELAHYYGLDELEKISQKAQKMIGNAEKKSALQEEKENKTWAKLGGLPSPKREKGMARIYMARAGAAYRDGNYDKAIKEWEKAGAADSTNITAKKRIEKVLQMIEKNKQVELEKAKQESIAQRNVAVKKYCKRGKFLYGRKDYKGSTEEFRKALAIDPGSKEAQKGLLKTQRQLNATNLKISKIVSKGNRYLGERKFLKAKKFALKALALEPDSASAKMLLQNAERGLGPR